MFGFGKILVLAVIIAAVWYGFKFVGRLQAKRQEELKDARREVEFEGRGRYGEMPAMRRICRRRWRRKLRQVRMSLLSF